MFVMVCARLMLRIYVLKIALNVYPFRLHPNNCLHATYRALVRLRSLEEMGETPSTRPTFTARLTTRLIRIEQIVSLMTRVGH